MAKEFNNPHLINSRNLENFTIVLMKPSGMLKTVKEHPLSILIEAMLVSAGLSVVERRRKQLMEDEVRKIYPILSIPDPVYGEDWKPPVIKHMISMPVNTYLVSGKLAEHKAKAIKNYIRIALIMPESDWFRQRVENFAHVVDKDDFFDSYKVLFL